MNLIFDFDGTICDSFDSAIEIVKKTFPEYISENITPDMARKMGVKKLIKEVGLPKYKIPQLMFKGSKEMAKDIPNLKTFPNIKNVVKTLSKENDLGIITSNSEDNVKLFLKNNKMSDFFDFVLSSTSLFGKDITINKVLKKYNLKKKDTIYIGDETRDIEAAKKVGIKSIAVTWGYEDESVLKKANPDVIAEKPFDLLSV